MCYDLEISTTPSSFRSDNSLRSCHGSARRLNLATTNHFFRSPISSRPPSLSFAHGRRLPSAFISYISSICIPTRGTVSSKNGATLARPVWNPAMTNMRASGDSERKWSMEWARFSCSCGIQRQSAASMRVWRWACEVANSETKSPH